MSNNGKKQSQPKNDRPKKRRKGMCLEDRPILENSAAGVDVGAREMARMCHQTGIRTRFKHSILLLRISIDWPTGWWRVELRR